MTVLISAALAFVGLVVSANTVAAHAMLASASRSPSPLLWLVFATVVLLTGIVFTRAAAPAHPRGPELCDP